MVEALGTLSALATLIVFISNWDTSGFTLCHSVLMAAGLFIICFCYALYQMQPKESIQLLMRDFRINISFGDLFQKKGIIVIPVNEYFDTIVDDKIIAHRTVHGQFIDKYFADNLPELDRAVNTALQAVTQPFEQRQRDSGRQKAYQIGTCIDIEHEDNTYVLFALTHFNKQDVAYLERKDFADAITSLMQHLHQMSNDRPVYMPIIGTGMSKMQRSHQRVLTYFLDCIDFADTSSLPAGLNIVAYEGDKDKVNLSLIEEYFEGALSK